MVGVSSLWVLRPRRARLRRFSQRRHGRLSRTLIAQRAIAEVLFRTLTGSADTITAETCSKMSQKVVIENQSPRAKGVSAAPAGWGAAAWWSLIVGLVLVFALLFTLAEEPFTAAFDRLEQRAGLADDASDEPAVAEQTPTPSVAEEARVEEPREPAWTLLDVEGAVSSMPPKIEQLIEEGRSELPEFRALASRDATRSARAQERWTAWARIWRNRVGRLGSQLPPPAACAVHAAMDPACQALRSILAQLESVADTDQLDQAQEQLEETAVALDLFLNPPEPEPEELESEEDAESAPQDPA